MFQRDLESKICKVIELESTMIFRLDVKVMNIREGIDGTEKVSD